MDWPGLILLLLCGLLAGTAILTAYTARMLLFPPRRGYGFAVARGIPADPRELRFLDEAGAEHVGASFDEWRLRSRGQELPVWDIRGCDPSGPVVVVTHGWGDSRVVSLLRTPCLLRHASRVVLWDLPGHGEATGSCALGTREAEDLCRLVEEIALHDPVSVVLYGHSMGAGISIAAAEMLGPARPAGVIAEAPYRFGITPARNVIRLAGFPYRVPLPLALSLIGLAKGVGAVWWRQRPGNAFDRAARAAGLRSRLLVVHGQSDLICPFEDAQAISAAAPLGTLFDVPDGGHLDLFTDARFLPVVEARVAEFLRECTAPAGAAPPAGSDDASRAHRAAGQDTDRFRAG